MNPITTATLLSILHASTSVAQWSGVLKTVPHGDKIRRGLETVRGTATNAPAPSGLALVPQQTPQPQPAPRPFVRDATMTLRNGTALELAEFHPGDRIENDRELQGDFSKNPGGSWEVLHDCFTKVTCALLPFNGPMIVSDFDRLAAFQRQSGGVELAFTDGVRMLLSNDAFDKAVLPSLEGTVHTLGEHLAARTSFSKIASFRRTQSGCEASLRNGGTLILTPCRWIQGAGPDYLRRSSLRTAIVRFSPNPSPTPGFERVLAQIQSLVFSPERFDEVRQTLPAKVVMRDGTAGDVFSLQACFCGYLRNGLKVCASTTELRSIAF